MALDLPPIVQSNQTNQPDMARTMLAAQQIKQGNVAAQHEADLPGAISAYQGGDQGALGQIYADNPEVANSLQSMALRKQEVGQEGALANVQIAGEKQKQQMAAIDLQNAKQNQTDLYAMQARPHLENMSDTVSKMEAAKADPTTIQDFITKAHAQGVEQLKAMGAPVNAHDDGTDYISNPTLWKQNAAAALQNIDMHTQNYQLRNMTPEQRQFKQFQSMSPEDRQNYLALQAKNPFMLTTAGGGGGAAGAAPAGPQVQGPTITGQPVSSPSPAAAAPIKNGAIDENVDLGKDALNTINSYPGSDQIKRMAKNMLLAQQPAPAMTSRTPPDVKEAFELAQQADPGYSTMSYPSKLKITNDFMSGQAATNVTAVNTLIHHLGRMADNDTKLTGNHGWDWVNATQNAAAEHFSDSAKASINDFNIDKGAIGSEASKAYKGVGAISTEEKNEWADKLNVNNGPKARADARAEIGTLAMGKIQALQDQWKQAYPNSTRSFFTPKAVEALKKLGVDTSDINLPGQTAAPKAPAAPALPPTDAKGGVLHADKNGVQAYVYPDGTFKEVK